MINFFLSILFGVVSGFLLAVSIRYGLRGASRLDDFFSDKRNSNYSGFEWYYRIPFSFGVVPEYFFALVLSYDNYFKRNWWALKTASFISVLLFIAFLKSRSAVTAYFSLDFLKEGGIGALFTSGSFVMFMNIIVLLYAALFVLICVESVRMHGVYAPVRIVVYSLLSWMMASLTLITLSAIVFIAVVYVVIKVIVFLFFSSRRRRKRAEEEEEEESAGFVLGKGFRAFKTELYQWEREEKNRTGTKNRTERTSKRIKRKRPKIKRSYGGDIPRLHPD
ncbi:MAG: hypothetical protein GXO86_02620 [Chlorobi bacterium]|nr:hypothetical protein [Chlorobiota bacterium]